MLVMHFQHTAGDRSFLSFCGYTSPLVSAETGDAEPAQIFVGALGASGFLYSVAVSSQQLPTGSGSHVGMCDFHGGSTHVWVPGNLKAGVTEASWYDPGDQLQLPGAGPPSFTGEL